MFNAVFSSNTELCAYFGCNPDHFDAALTPTVIAQSGIPKGGNPGDILAKRSDEDRDVEWVTPADSATLGDNRPITADAVARFIANYSSIYYDTQENWDSDRTIIAERNAVYVYTNHSYDGDKALPAIKIGDGSSYLIDMPYIGDDIMKILIDHINDTSIHVTAQEKQFWNNKVSAYVDRENIENLVFTTADLIIGG